MSENSQRRVFVVSGPSGVGKTTIIKRILEGNPDIELSVSSTTRQPRDGEVDGIDYYFIDRAEFERKLQEKEYLEWATVYGNYYGTMFSHVMKILQNGTNALLDVDSQGAMQIKKITRGALFVLIAPPSLESLAGRLRNRGSESEESFAMRMARAQHELSFRDEYDRVVVNDDMEVAIADLQAIIDAARKESVPFIYETT